MDYFSADRLTALSLSTVLAARSTKYVLFAAEEGVDIKTRRVAVLSFFLIEGAGREKLSPAGLSLKSNT